MVPHCGRELQEEDHSDNLATFTVAMAAAPWWRVRPPGDGEPGPAPAEAEDYSPAIAAAIADAIAAARPGSGLSLTAWPTS